MAKKRKSEYTVNCSDMFGLDLGQDRKHFSSLTNMYRDHIASGGEVIESIPGFRAIAALGERINGIFSTTLETGDSCIVVHAGKSLYLFGLDELDSTATPTPLLTTMQDRKSHAFLKGGTLFILDGERITRVRKDATAYRMLNIDAYVPTTFKNGEPYEERSLTGTYFVESMTVTDPARLTCRSDNLVFRRSPDGASCILCSCGTRASGEIYVPAYAMLSGELLPVKAIGDYAFYGRDGITEIHVADGVRSVGRYAFAGCTILRTAEMPRSMETLGDNAFKGCSALTSVYLGEELNSFGESVFDAASSTTLTLSFGQDEDTAQKIDNYFSLESFKKEFRQATPPECFSFPIKTPAKEVQTLTLNGSVISDFAVTGELTGETAREIRFRMQPSELIGKELKVRCRHAEGKSHPYVNRVDFESRLIDGAAPIAGCTCHAYFDGRVFLSGNPNYPGTVFYTSDVHTTESDALLFGSLSYFDVGPEPRDITSLVGLEDMLAVFKSGNGTGEDIVCYVKGREDVFPSTSYPVLSFHSGFGVVGKAIAHLGAAVFLSDSGVYLLSRSGGHSNVKLCSKRINSALIPLLEEDSDMTVWQGYLVIAARKKLFLGDTRRTLGSDRYEWYPLDGICSYTNDRRVFAYAPTAPEGYSIGSVGEECRSETVFSESTATGETVYYVLKNGVKIAVLPTTERFGGTEDLPRVFHSNGDRLFFGTDGGALMVFNNDKRGVAPERISKLPGFDASEYKRLMQNRIHPDFYAFGDHAARYTLMTPPEDLGIPSLAKRTVKDSLILKIGGETSLYCSIITDGGIDVKKKVLTGKSVDFGDLDFSRLSFDTRKYATIGVRDRTSGWNEKQILIESDGFRSPISICSVAYRAEYDGKIKR